MRSRLALVAVLALLMFSVANPLAYVDSCTRGNEHQEAMFSTAADGDESSESITSFSETLSDDVLFYPDSFLDDTVVVASGGMLYAGDTPTGDYTDTQQVGDTYWTVLDSSPGEVNYSVYFATPSSTYIEGIRIALYCCESPALIHDAQDVMIRKDGGVWEDVGDIPDDTWGWVNVSLYGDDYWNASYVEVGLYLTNSTTQAQGLWKYAEVTFYYMHLADSAHYAESFADVSDWSEYGGSFEAGDGFSSDGDLLELEVGYQGSASADLIESDVFSGLSILYYYEMRWKVNATFAGTGARIYLWLRDGDGDRYQWLSDPIDTDWHTQQGIISGMTQLDNAVGDIVIANIVAYCPNDGDAVNFQVDYLRIGPADEMGWQHDGSTTAGTSGLSSCTVTTDGDKLNVTGTSGSSGYFDLTMDTTATVARIEEDYYQFAELSISAVNNADADGLVGCPEIYGSDGNGYIVSGIWFTDAGIYRTNIIAGGSGDPYKIRFYVDGGDWYTIDYVKFYSIANFTVTQSGVTTDDVLYVEDGILYSTIDDGYIELNHDPAFTVNTATYNIWNTTTGGTSPEFDNYVGSWAGYSSETRGSLSSGTLTDLKLKFDSIESISAIKFIEDGTAPDILDRFVNPSDPDDDEEVTFTAVTTDTVEVYKVTLNAIVYPAGFSDVDYDMTEQESDVLWYYTFSTMTAGYYLFSIVATDGANTHTDYLPLTIREAAITINPITFLGAGDDFEDVTLSFECNRDGSYSITEWTLADGSDAAETWTGTVINGWNNIAWDKLTTTSNTVYFNFTITSGSLEWIYENQYQVAQVVFSVELADKQETFDYVYLQGESTKAASYSVYDVNDILRYTGTIPEGSWSLSFEMWNKRSLAEHAYGIKFVNGTSTDWINGTYYANSPDQYKGGGVDVGPPAWWADPMTWVIIGASLAGLYVFTSGQKFGKIPDAPKGMK